MLLHFKILFIMPQFDFFSFFSQFSSTTFGFFILYLIFLNLFLRQLFFSIKFRQKINSYASKIYSDIKKDAITVQLYKRV